MKLAPIQVTPELEAYMESLLPPRDPVLARIEDEVANESIPAIGPSVGQLFYLQVKMRGCRDVLELGAAVGYSTIWLAHACSGRVVTLEIEPERAERARANVREAGLAARVEVVEEDALAYLGRSQARFDCIFNDLLNSFPDENAVQRCLEMSVETLNEGGLLLADNALGRGQVTTPNSRQARNITRYNALVARDPRLESVIVPLRDGVSIALLSG